MKKSISEYNIQKIFCCWCNQQESVLAHWHVPNGMTSDAKQGKLMKMIGLKKGVWDYWLITNKGTLVVIEFKDDKGKLSKEQIEFEKALTFAKIPHAVCRSAYDAVKFVQLFTK